jgi:hypothetical protein
VITEAVANQVWDILVKEAGANEGVEREAFLHHAVGQNYVQEYRFQGRLGFGGKVFLREQDVGWRVYYYSEHRNDEREEIRKRTDAALATINVPERDADTLPDQIESSLQH